MIRVRSHVRTLLKLTLVSACAAMVILWPTWRAALQAHGNYQECSECRMTGGGNCTAGAIQVTHGFELQCNPSEEPNNLEVNWSNGIGSHRCPLDELTDASCVDVPGYDEGQPVAGFDTYFGVGTGSYDGVSGATAEWTFTDKGEPGKNDTLDLIIRDMDNLVVLEAHCTLSGGNHQAHPETPTPTPTSTRWSSASPAAPMPLASPSTPPPARWRSWSRLTSRRPPTPAPTTSTTSSCRSPTASTWTRRPSRSPSPT